MGNAADLHICWLYYFCIWNYIWKITNSPSSSKMWCQWDIPAQPKTGFSDLVDFCDLDTIYRMSNWFKHYYKLTGTNNIHDMWNICRKYISPKAGLPTGIWLNFNYPKEDGFHCLGVVLTAPGITDEGPNYIAFWVPTYQISTVYLQKCRLGWF